MRARPIRVYLDANVLIAYVADEEGRAGVVQMGSSPYPPDLFDKPCQS